MTLTGKVGGGTLTISGTLAADGKSLTGASYNVAGGSCAFSAKAAATAQAYSSVTGTYSGSFADAGGQVISVVANLTQTPESDTDGNFTLSGDRNVSEQSMLLKPGDGVERAGDGAEASRLPMPIRIR